MADGMNQPAAHPAIAKPRRQWVLMLPLAVVALLFGLFIYRLALPGDTLVASRWVNQPMPRFELPPATPGIPGLSSADLATGQPQLVNIFASWCVPCKVEAPQLDALAKEGVPIQGIAIRDRPEDVAKFLAEAGNPFQRIGSDFQSSVQIALGSSGVPETFVVDGKGIVREQIQGIITPEMLPELRAKLAALK